MEPITLCGLVIVMFGLWVEFEPATRAIIKMISKINFIAEFVSNSTVRKPVSVSRMPICLAKAYRC